MSSPAWVDGSTNMAENLTPRGPRGIDRIESEPLQIDTTLV